MLKAIAEATEVEKDEMYVDEKQKVEVKEVEKAEVDEVTKKQKKN